MFFRKRKLIRAAACFFLLETLSTLVAPSVGWAMMGPGQPEFTSYEASGSPDLVNLTTGDFTYNVPVIEVPGPERSFSMPLTYRAGIKLEQEASWVGLGWSLNAGAIARSVTGYPDDADGEPMQSTYQQKITRGWTGGVPGILNLGWDVNTGHSGSASLLGLVGLGWSGGGISSGSLVGIHASKEGITANPIEMVAAAVTIATLGSAGPIMQVAAAAATQIGTDAATGIAASVLLGKSGSSGGGLGEPTVKEESGFLYTNYWVFYNDQKTERMYGSLHFDDMSQQVKPVNSDNLSPQIYYNNVNNPAGKSPEFDFRVNSGDYGRYTSGPGADLFLYNPPGTDKNSFWNVSNNALSIAHDDFSVMGGNVSGSIRPYRLEVGSLAFPYQGTDEHLKYATIPYLNSYKVPFRYENSLSNGYDYHQFAPGAATTTDAVGIDGQWKPYFENGWTGGLVLKDPSLYDQNARTAPARKGIINQYGDRKLVQGKNIKWFTNEEILQQYANSTDGNGSFLETDYPVGKNIPTAPVITGYTGCDPSDPYCQSEPITEEQPPVWSNNPWRITLPGKGVGAFAITAEDGTTYHYSLPVYHYTQYSTSRQVKKPADAEAPGVSTQTIGTYGSHHTGGGYATTWLLTAITSSDYVDRNKLGTVDDSDWGGWIRFDYGKFSSTYKWRQPYVGENFDAKSFNDASFAEGYKETYYLNSIRTRSHTALFIKSVRNDARGHYQSTPSNLGFDERQPASSLRLDEVVLLTNDDLAKLQKQDGIRTETGEVGESAVPALSNNTAGNNTQYDASELWAGDTYQNVLDQHDVDADTRIRAFINQRAQKRVVFNYSYRLCASTPNSFAYNMLFALDQDQFRCNHTGKLTLESVSTYGPANTKLTPDFKFKYGFNPDYQRDSWDGFGMYKSDVSIQTDYNGNPIGQPMTYHQTSTDFALASRDAAAWSLTEITSPLGGKTRIRYERDQYAHVSEYPAQKIVLTNNDCSNSFTTNVANAADYLRVGDVVQAEGFFSYPYSYTEPVDDNNPQYGYETRYGDCGQSLPNNQFHVEAISGNTVTISASDVPGSDPNCTGDGSPGGARLTMLASTNKNGGDLRVATISTSDEDGREYQVNYSYANDQPYGSNSSGVISKEPALVAHEILPFESVFDYPGTGVMYGRATVYRGLFRGGNKNDYSQAEEYTFQTPVSSMVSSSRSSTGKLISQGDTYQREWRNGRWEIVRDGNGDPVTIPYTLGWRKLDNYANATVVDLGSIGQPISIKKYNSRREVESSTSFGYSHTLPNTDGIAKQGYFTEGVMTNELLGGHFYRINRSTKEYRPTVMVSSTTTTNGITTQSRQEKFDFYTGQVVESSFRNFLGAMYRSKVVPAYTLPLYAAMGPASAHPANRNMLTQEAASYVYKIQPTDARSVVSASVQTWSSDWSTYRGYDATADAYVDRADDPRPIWRLCQSYVWVSPKLNSDGTYANFVDFDWGQTSPANQAANWVKAGEFTRYDHYSKPLESRDINGQYVARKLGYNQAQRLVTAANARYAEVAYSGAEDLVDQGSGVVHFGGEVRGGGRRSALKHHTGLYSTRLQAGEAGFTYQAKLGSEVRGGQKYRLSCWIHQSDASRQGQLYAQVDGQDLSTATIASNSTKQAGEWYLVTLLVDVPTSGQQLTVGCRAGAGATDAIFVDDFRFQPLLSPTTAYVYDPTTAQLTYVLDNDNLFTHYEYDAAGKVARISKEVLTPAGSTQSAERRVKEYSYNFAEMMTPTWLPTGLLTWSQITGQRQHEERDINPRSSTYGQTQNVDDGYLPMCNPGSAPAGQVITLKGANGQYVSSENGQNPMLCNRPTAQNWEHFVVVNAGNGKVALMNQGKFVSSENGEKPITCNRPAIGVWEKFDWVKNADGSVSLRGNNGRFISNENGSPMTCNRQRAYAYESFLVGN